MKDENGQSTETGCLYQVVSHTLETAAVTIAHRQDQRPLRDTGSPEVLRPSSEPIVKPRIIAGLLCVMWNETKKTKGHEKGDESRCVDGIQCSVVSGVLHEPKCNDFIAIPIVEQGSVVMVLRNQSQPVSNRYVRYPADLRRHRRLLQAQRVARIQVAVVIE